MFEGYPLEASGSLRALEEKILIYYIRRLNLKSYKQFNLIASLRSGYADVVGVASG